MRKLTLKRARAELAAEQKLAAERRARIYDESAKRAEVAMKVYTDMLGEPVDVIGAFGFGDENQAGWRVALRGGLYGQVVVDAYHGNATGPAYLHVGRSNGTSKQLCRSYSLDRVDEAIRYTARLLDLVNPN